jgi:hypothetical protein
MLAICYRPSSLSFLVGPVANLAQRGASGFPLRWLSNVQAFELVGCVKAPEEALSHIRKLLEDAKRAGKDLGPLVDVRVFLLVNDGPQMLADKGSVWNSHN